MGTTEKSYEKIEKNNNEKQPFLAHNNVSTKCNSCGIQGFFARGHLVVGSTWRLAVCKSANATIFLKSVGETFVTWNCVFFSQALPLALPGHEIMRKAYCCFSGSRVRSPNSQSNSQSASPSPANGPRPSCAETTISMQQTFTQLKLPIMNGDHKFPRKKIKDKRTGEGKGENGHVGDSDGVKAFLCWVLCQKMA